MQCNILILYFFVASFVLSLRMFCSTKNMFGLKNIANILGVPQDDAFAKPSAPSSGYCDKVVPGIPESMFANSTDAKDAKENTEVKPPIPTFPKEVSHLVPDDASDADDYIDIPFVDEETEELRRELASARQALKNLRETLATQKVELDVAQAKKDKILGNLRTKRSLLLQVQARNVQLEDQLACEQSKHKVATDETESLRVGLLSVSASREDLKQKLKSRQESLKHARAEQEDLESKLARWGQHRRIVFSGCCHTGYSSGASRFGAEQSFPMLRKKPPLLPGTTAGTAAEATRSTSFDVVTVYWI
jgi:hypothetical protein